MIAAFKTRSPWAAAILTLFFGPIIGMCYVNRGKLVLLYLAISLTGFTLCIAAIWYGILNINPLHAIMLVECVIRIVGIIHAFRIAREGDQSEPIKWYSRWYSLVFFIIFPSILAGGFRHFLYQPFHIPSSSMSPNVNLGDVLFVEKFAYKSQLPQRGDVIVFYDPHNHVPFIKRVMGLPGEKVQMKDGFFYINDAKIPQDRITDFNLRDSKGQHMVYQFVETLPEGKKINILRTFSNAPFDNTPVYIVPDHQYFVLGDNRDNSRDSRDQQTIGFISEENILGKCGIIYWNDYAAAFSPHSAN